MAFVPHLVALDECLLDMQSLKAALFVSCMVQQIHVESFGNDNKLRIVLTQRPVRCFHIINTDQSLQLFRGRRRGTPARMARQEGKSIDQPLAKAIEILIITHQVFTVTSLLSLSHNLRTGFVYCPSTSDGDFGERLENQQSGELRQSSLE